VTEPRLVLLDEPLGALDANLRARMRDELRKLRDRLGVTFLHVTGSETEALAMGDHVIVLDSGRVSQFDAPGAIYSHPATPDVARSLNCYNLFAGRLGAEGFSCAHEIFAVARIDVKCAQATYAIRHDLVRFADPQDSSPPEQTGLLAKFVTSEYSGSTIRYFFEARTGQIVEVENHLSHSRPVDLEPGRDYRLTWAAEQAVVFG
jgi:ABC-type Fe3+/spermidine/putrescine transport system ATPase subunit